MIMIVVLLGEILDLVDDAAGLGAAETVFGPLADRLVGRRLHCPTRP